MLSVQLNSHLCITTTCRTKVFIAGGGRKFYLFYFILQCKPHIKEYNTQIIICTVNQHAGKKWECNSSLNLTNSSRSTSELGREFHRVMVDGKNECKNVSVLAKGATKRWLWPRVEDECGVNVIGTSTIPCSICKILSALGIFFAVLIGATLSDQAC